MSASPIDSPASIKVRTQPETPCCNRVACSRPLCASSSGKQQYQPGTRPELQSLEGWICLLVQVICSLQHTTLRSLSGRNIRRLTVVAIENTTALMILARKLARSREGSRPGPVALHSFIWGLGFLYMGPRLFAFCLSCASMICIRAGPQGCHRRSLQQAVRHRAGRPNLFVHNFLGQTAQEHMSVHLPRLRP